VIPLDLIEAARERLAGRVLRTPVVELDGVHLKLENLSRSARSSCEARSTRSRSLPARSSRRAS
jgi:hypothetical protein